jgi:site-specific recombinase XerD
MRTEHEQITGFVEELERRGVSHNTVRNYRQDLLQFVPWFEMTSGDEFSAENVTPTDVRQFRSYQQANRGLKPATVNRRIASLRSFFEWARGQKLVTINPTTDIPQVESQRLAPRSLSRAELNRLTREVEKDALGGVHLGLRNLAIIQMLRYTGVRVQELCDLKLEDIEMGERKGTLTVRSGKGQKYRQIPLNSEMRKALNDYLEVRPRRGDEELFLGQRGLLSTEAVRRVILKYATRAGVDGVTPHVFRHSFGRGLVDAGVDLVTVAALLGHSKIETTMVYTQPRPEDLEKAVEKLEAS